jgi:centromere protein J
MDGRHERLFASGLRETRFANGSLRRALPGGATLTRFANGDLKQELPGGTVQYWYREVASWQVTHPNGVDVYHFPSGQVRAGSPCWALSCLCLWQQQHPSGGGLGHLGAQCVPRFTCAPHCLQVEAHHPGGVKEVWFPDGAVRKVLPDGRELGISAAHLSAEVQAAAPAPLL